MTLCSCSRLGSCSQLRDRVLHLLKSAPQVMEEPKAQIHHQIEDQELKEVLSRGGIKYTGKQAGTA